VYSRDATGLRSARTWNRAGTGPATADVETSFDYDSLGWVRRERSSLWTNPVTFARDTAGRWTEANLGAQTLSRTFASWDRLDTVRVGTRTIADFEYPPGISSPTSVAYGNGLTETRSYDHRGRRVSGDARLGAAPRFAQTWTWGEDDGLARWDAVVGATRRALVSKADDRGRLVDVGVHTGLSAPASSRATPADVNSWLSGAAQRETYVYDASDRMTEKRVGGTPKYPQHRDDGALISWDGQTVPVDGAGRPTTIGGSVVEYDGAGRLIASTPPNGARTTYLYDGLDRLVGWDVGGVAHRFHYAEGQIVEDREGGATRLLVPGEGGAPIATVVGAAEYTNLIGPGDRLVASLDAAGTLVERYESMGHAPPRFMNGAGVAQASSTIGNRMLLSGQPWAPQLGSHRQGFRWYQPTWGRFTSTDPLGYIDGPNTFAYGGMNPWRWTDPLGLKLGELGAKWAHWPGDRSDRPRAILVGEPGEKFAGLSFAWTYGREAVKQDREICSHSLLCRAADADYGAGQSVGTMAIDIEEALESAARVYDQHGAKAAALSLLPLLGVVVSENGDDADKQGPPKPGTLADLLADEPELLNEARKEHAAHPEWQGIDPDQTPVMLRPRTEVEDIRKKPGESGGHHPHGLALGGPEGQTLTPTGDTKDKVNPAHAKATGLQRRLINALRRSGRK